MAQPRRQQGMGRKRDTGGQAGRRAGGCAAGCSGPVLTASACAEVHSCRKQLSACTWLARNLPVIAEPAKPAHAALGHHSPLEMLTRSTATACWVLGAAQAGLPVHRARFAGSQASRRFVRPPKCVCSAATACCALANSRCLAGSRARASLTIARPCRRSRQGWRSRRLLSWTAGLQAGKRHCPGAGEAGAAASGGAGAAACRGVQPRCMLEGESRDSLLLPAVAAVHLVRQNRDSSLQARKAYAAFLDRLRQQYQPERIQDGVFGAMMQVGSGSARWAGRSDELGVGVVSPTLMAPGTAAVAWAASRMACLAPWSRWAG